MILTVKQLEELEAKRLAPYAMKSRDSKGRMHRENPSESAYGRLCFQKDRDRIIHCKAFRRLDEKAQVFPAFFGDHYRTRLTHTLEVAQIARDIARRLGLNEDLSEAIALAHDLGHPPFGHTGEDALNEMMIDFGDHFEHNEQSRRVVTKLEKLYPDFDGLNLSVEVLEGLEKHKTSWDRTSLKDEGFVSAHFEGQVVNLADEIAYTNHDIDDGLRSKILKIPDLEETSLWNEARADITKVYGEIDSEEVMIARVVSKITNMMIVDICESFAGASGASSRERVGSPLVAGSRERVGMHDDNGAGSREGVGSERSDGSCFSAGSRRFAGSPSFSIDLKFGKEMAKKVTELRDVLYKKFYMSKEVRTRLIKGKKMIKELFEFYLKNPKKVHEKYRTGEKIEVAIKDYIAGMTDQFLKSELNKNLKLR